MQNFSNMCFYKRITSWFRTGWTGCVWCMLLHQSATCQVFLSFICSWRAHCRHLWRTLTSKRMLFCIFFIYIDSLHCWEFHALGLLLHTSVLWHSSHCSSIRYNLHKQAPFLRGDSVFYICLLLPNLLSYFQQAHKGSIRLLCIELLNGAPAFPDTY